MKKALSLGRKYQHISDYFCLSLSPSAWQDHSKMQMNFILLWLGGKCGADASRSPGEGCVAHSFPSIPFQSITWRSLGVDSWNLIKSSEKLMLFVAGQVTVFSSNPIFFMAATETPSWHCMEMTDAALSVVNMFYIVEQQYVSSVRFYDFSARCQTRPLGCFFH